MKTTLQLYVWTGFAPDYSDGLAFAIAASEDEAREAIIKQLDYRPADWGWLQALPLDRCCAFAVYGGG